MATAKYLKSLNPFKDCLNGKEFCDQLGEENGNN